MAFTSRANPAGSRRARCHTPPHRLCAGFDPFPAGKRVLYPVENPASDDGRAVCDAGSVSRFRADCVFIGFPDRLLKLWKTPCSGRVMIELGECQPDFLHRRLLKRQPVVESGCWKSRRRDLNPQSPRSANRCSIPLSYGGTIGRGCSSTPGHASLGARRSRWRRAQDSNLWGDNFLRGAAHWNVIPAL